MARLELARREVRVGGRVVRYRVGGEGEPVILVHGLAGSFRWWSRNIPTLAERFRVYVVNLPGFGSLRPGRGRFALTEAAGWLLAWMDALQLTRVHLIGHSMGGYICLRLAVDRPSVVSRLILVAPAGLGADRPMFGYLLPFLRALRHASPSFLPMLATDAVRAGPRTLWRASRDLVGEDVGEHLSSVTAPTLLVWGENDRLIPATVGHVLRAQIPSARLVILERAGHVPMFDRPREFNVAALRFLAGEPIGE